MAIYFFIKSRKLKEQLAVRKSAQDLSEDRSSNLESPSPSRVCKTQDMLNDEDLVLEKQYHPGQSLDIFGRGDPIKAYVNRLKANQDDVIEEAGSSDEEEGGKAKELNSSFNHQATASKLAGAQ